MVESRPRDVAKPHARAFLDAHRETGVCSATGFALADLAIRWIGSYLKNGLSNWPAPFAVTAVRADRHNDLDLAVAARHVHTT